MWRRSSFGWTEIQRSRSAGSLAMWFLPSCEWSHAQKSKSAGNLAMWHLIEPKLKTLGGSGWAFSAVKVKRLPTATHPWEELQEDDKLKQCPQHFCCFQLPHDNLIPAWSTSSILLRHCRCSSNSSNTPFLSRGSEIWLPQWTSSLPSCLKQGKNLLQFHKGFWGNIQSRTKKFMGLTARWQVAQIAFRWYTHIPRPEAIFRFKLQLKLHQILCNLATCIGTNQRKPHTIIAKNNMMQVFTLMITPNCSGQDCWKQLQLVNDSAFVVSTKQAACSTVKRYAKPFADVSMLVHQNTTQSSARGFRLKASISVQKPLLANKGGYLARPCMAQSLNHGLQGGH